MKGFLFRALPTVALIVVSLLVEGAARALLPTIPSLDLFVTSSVQLHGFTDARRVSIFEGDPMRAWRLKPDLRHAIWDYTVVSTNRQGLRRDAPITPKPAGALRIVCLGDSVTFGFRVPVVWAERPDDYDREALPYPQLLEKRLRAKRPGQAIDVLPLAVPGYSSHQGLAWLRQECGRLRPDIVTACFGWNDVQMHPASDHEVMPTGTLRVAARSAVAASQTLSHLVVWRRSRRAPRGDAALRARVSLADYVANFRAMARVARDSGAVFVVIAPCYRDRTTFPDEAGRIGGYREALARAMAEDGVPYLVVPELTEAGFPENQGLFGELIHPNHLGHRLLDERLYAFLKETGLLPR